MSDNNNLIPRGVYRIVAAKVGEIGANALTRLDGGHVTLLPRDAHGVESNEQLWDVRPSHQENGIVTITKPSPIIPSIALTYEGEAKAGAQITARVEEFATEWHVGIAPGFRHSLQLSKHRDLGIALSPALIFPPRLVLGEGAKQLAFIFEFVRPLV